MAKQTHNPVLRAAILETLDLKPGEKVLEIGFGTGNGILDLARLVGASGAVSGIDISPGMLAVAQRKIGRESIKTPIDLRVADARQLPFPDEAFDAAYSSFTLELFPSEDLPVVLAGGGCCARMAASPQCRWRR
jgi:ubiquinone/menaquinone biosynthesis C-methylase UbiE